MTGVQTCALPICLAIDTAAAGIGTVKNVRGTGLSSYDEDGEDLKVETIDGQEDRKSVV